MYLWIRCKYKNVEQFVSHPFVIIMNNKNMSKPFNDRF